MTLVPRMWDQKKKKNLHTGNNCCFGGPGLLLGEEGLLCQDQEANRKGQAPRPSSLSPLEHSDLATLVQRSFRTMVSDHRLATAPFIPGMHRGNSQIYKQGAMHSRQDTARCMPSSTHPSLRSAHQAHTTYLYLRGSSQRLSLRSMPKGKLGGSALYVNPFICTQCTSGSKKECVHCIISHTGSKPDA